MVIAIAPSMEERLRVAQLINNHAPVLLVSTREEAVALLTRGADPPTLAAVAEAVLDDGEPTNLPDVLAHAVPDPPGTPSGRVEADGLVLDSDWRVVRWDQQSVPLSPLEHDLLLCLLGGPGRTWTFERIHQQVWGNDHLGGRDDVQSVVKRLRRKLRELGSPYGIHAVRGVGLRLVDHRFGGPEMLP